MNIVYNGPIAEGQIAVGEIQIEFKRQVPLSVPDSIANGDETRQGLLSNPDWSVHIESPAINTQPNE